MSNPRTPEEPERFDLVPAGEHPPELRALLLAAGDDAGAKDALVKVFYGVNEGAHNSASVYHGILLSAIYNAIRRDVQGLLGAIKERDVTPKPAANGQVGSLRREPTERMSKADLAIMLAGEIRKALPTPPPPDKRWSWAKVKRIAPKYAAALAIGILIGGGAIWAWAMHAADGRVAEIAERYDKAIRELPTVERFAVQLRDLGGSLTYRNTEGQANASGIVINFGGVRKIAHVSQDTKGNVATIDLEPEPTPTPKPTPSPTTATRKK
jgi:hypothetical protein